MDPAYQWDLSSLFKNDEEWEAAFQETDSLIAQIAQYEGRLNNASDIRNFLDADTQAERKMDNLLTYASLRRSEDTRAEQAQSMYARVFGKYVAFMTVASFAEPEILSLDEDLLKEIAEDEQLKPYAFTLENLVRRKPHTLSAAEEKLLA